MGADITIIEGAIELNEMELVLSKDKRFLINRAEDRTIDGETVRRLHIIRATDGRFIIAHTYPGNTNIQWFRMPWAGVSLVLEMCNRFRLKCEDKSCHYFYGQNGMHGYGADFKNPRLIP